MQIFCFEIFTPSKIMQGMSDIKADEKLLFVY
jgi:hypothetical protein